MEEVFEPLTDTLQKTSENITRLLQKLLLKTSKAISDLNEKVLELVDEKGLIAAYLALSLVNLFKPENKSQFRLKKDLNSTEMNDFLIHENIPVSLHSNMIIFRNSNKSFKLDGDLLELITNYKFNADHSRPKEKKINL